MQYTRWKKFCRKNFENVFYITETLSPPSCTLPSLFRILAIWNLVLYTLHEPSLGLQGRLLRRLPSGSFSVTFISLLFNQSRRYIMKKHTMHKITNVATGNNTSNNMVSIYATTANGQVFRFNDLVPSTKASGFVAKITTYGVINTSCWTKVRNANGTRPNALLSLRS